ncbi:hypothetical protein UACE39S_05219 [Ureibacillus acetophenoni]
MSLKLEHVVKKYKDFTAVNDLNFLIGKGEIFGLIGQIRLRKRQLSV